jgi:hypothetical protein
MAALLYPFHFPTLTLSPSPELEFLESVALFFFCALFSRPMRCDALKFIAQANVAS